MKKLLLATALTICLLANSMAQQCGANLTWQFQNQTLTISGSGAMYDYNDNSPAPWKQYNDQIRNIVLPNGLTHIGEEAFALTAVESLTIPNTVKSIGVYAMYGCENLTALQLSSQINIIDESVFENCTALTTLNLPSNIKILRGSAFAGCSNLSTISFSLGLDSIGDYAFYECGKLSSALLPEGVHTIGASAFYKCKLMQSISLPSTLESVGIDAFKGCSGLQETIFGGDIEEWVAIKFDNYAANSTYYSHRLKINGENITTITIPEGVRQIRDFAFTGCQDITQATLPNSLQTIGEDAFYQCYGLTSITIPDSVKTLPYGAFWSCSSLKTVNLPSLNKIEDRAFYGCTALEQITINTSTPPQTYAETFYEVSPSTKVIVHCSASQFRTANNWQNFQYEEDFLCQIKAVSEDETKGTVSISGGTSCEDLQASLEAIGAGEYIFDHWSDGNTDNPRQITLDKDYDLTATFKNATGLVDVNKDTREAVEKFLHDGILYFRTNQGIFDMMGRQVDL